MIQILLSTYNGAAYLRPLFESLLEQDYPSVEILVRDDGSCDGTVELLHAYATVHANVRVVFGANVGFVRSFFELLRLASPLAHYVALCDQDDVWEQDKVSRAVEFLSRCPQDVPSLYCSRLTVVNEKLKPLGYSELPTKGLSFRNALVENQVRGCTCLLNQAARRLLLQVPSTCVSHDWWIYLVVSAFGNVVYDNEPRILYRSHPANTFGISTGNIETWKTKIRQFLKTRTSNLIVKQAEEFRRIHGSLLSDEHRQVIERLLERRKHVWDRLRYAWSCDVYRQSTRDQYLMKARIALNCL